MGKSRKSDNHGDNEYRRLVQGRSQRNRNKRTKNFADERRVKDARSQSYNFDDTFTD